MVISARAEWVELRHREDPRQTVFEDLPHLVKSKLLPEMQEEEFLHLPMLARHQVRRTGAA